MRPDPDLTPDPGPDPAPYSTPRGALVVAGFLTVTILGMWFLVLGVLQGRG